MLIDNFQFYKSNIFIKCKNVTFIKLKIVNNFNLKLLKNVFPLWVITAKVFKKKKKKLQIYLKKFNWILKMKRWRKLVMINIHKNRTDKDYKCQKRFFCLWPHLCFTSLPLTESTNFSILFTPKVWSIEKQLTPVLFLTSLLTYSMFFHSVLPYSLCLCIKLI